MIRFQCTACGRQMQADDAFAGQTMKCPSCQAELIVPAPAAPSPAVGNPPPMLSAMPPMPPMTPVTPVASAPAAQGGKGMAVTALVLGILGGFPLFGLIAIVLGIIVLATKRAGRGMAIAGLILGVVMPIAVAAAVAVLVPALGQAREYARIAACAANTSMLSKGVAMYASDHSGAYPASLDELTREGVIGAGSLQCPSVQQHRESDYFYFPPARNADARTLMICEFRGNHSRGRNVAYVDSSVKFITSDQEFQAELSKPENAQFAAALRAAEGPDLRIKR